MFVGGGMASPKTLKKHTKKHRRHHHHHGHHHNFHPPQDLQLSNLEASQMFQSSGQSDVKPPVFSSQANLVLIYRSIEGMKGELTLLSP
ncbi:hypothetical protein TNCV_1877731 [Trichonephila clavipes]|nr:hypothetical protein TNCV_1877731 [Trichonephila clavipes]